MKTLSDRLNSIYNESVRESNIHGSSMKKVLKLFGYNNSYNNVFLKRYHKLNSVLDVHKFESVLDTDVVYVMCIEHQNNEVCISGALYEMKKIHNNKLTITTLKNIKTIHDVGQVLKSIDPLSQLILNYD